MLVSPPRAPQSDIQTLDATQARLLFEQAKGDRFEALYVLALTSGMRLGELLALHWRDVDLDAGALQVRATLHEVKGGFQFAERKTEHSRRRVLLSQTAITALRGHRAAQAGERLRAGGDWGDRDLVFANELGRPVSASNLRNRSYWPLLKAAGLPRLRFHDLRHTAATLLLGQGVHPKVVSEMLGHSRITVTLDLYSHVTPTMQEAATRAMDSVLRA